jgi:catechol 2,3-dioxygenase-like lactoylglutathione lyase family enzyme
VSPLDRLRVAHLIGLAAIAGWLAWAHPGGWLPALLVALIAASGEFLPRGAWRELGAPVLTLFAAASAWAASGGGRGAIHALLGTLVSALLLIPARPGVLRMLAPLAVLELVVIGLPGTISTTPWTAVIVLPALACLALATDAWFEARLGARLVAPSSRLAWLRWAVLPALFAAALGTGSYAPAAQIAEAVRPGPVRLHPGTGGDTAPRSGRSRDAGDLPGIDPGGAPPRDPSPVARLFLPTNPDRLVYLRLAACSRLQRDVESGRLRWLPAPGEVEVSGSPPPDHAALGDLVRMGGLGESVLLPDDGDWAGLSDMWADGDGNRYRPELGGAVRSYRVAVDGGRRREPEADLQQALETCRELPPIIEAWPWAEVEDRRWASLPPEVAADSIAMRLRGRCAYDLKPPQGSSDPFATFLFGAESERRGTCEHFAGAAALLLRRAGHPARCVTGFASAEWDGSGITFRRLHAHAWVEVLLPDGRWVRRDPTPPVAHDLVAQDLNPAANPPPQAALAVPLPERRRSYWWLLLLGLAGACAVITVLRRTRQRRRPDPQAVHRRRGIELVELARTLGVKVEAKDTAAVICTRITARTGVDLGPQLTAYEAARFGDGPPAPPWPPCR